MHRWMVYSMIMCGRTCSVVRGSVLHRRVTNHGVLKVSGYVFLPSIAVLSMLSVFSVFPALTTVMLSAVMLFTCMMMLSTILFLIVRCNMVGKVWMLNVVRMTVVRNGERVMRVVRRSVLFTVPTVVAVRTVDMVEVWMRPMYVIRTMSDRAAFRKDSVNEQRSSITTMAY